MGQGPGAAYLFHQPFPIQGPAVILMNVLFSPVLWKGLGHLSGAFFTPTLGLSFLRSAMVVGVIGWKQGAKVPSYHRVVKDLPEVWV